MTSKQPDTRVASFRVSVVLPASAERLYRAFLDSKEHAAFTGAPAHITARTGGKFSAYDGHVTGKLLELEPNGRIVLAWRTKDFPEGAPDSRVEIAFQPATGGTRVTIAHAGLPTGTDDRYKSGWQRFYFDPMRRHFRAGREPEPASVPKQPARPRAAAAKQRQ